MEKTNQGRNKRKIIISLSFGKDTSPVHIELDSVYAAEKVLGINRGFIHRIASQATPTVGVLSVSGNIFFEDMKDVLKEDSPKESEKIVKDHLTQYAWKCGEHGVWIARGKPCPLCENGIKRKRKGV